MAKIGRNLQALAAEIERRAEAKRDFLAPVPKFAIEVANEEPVIALGGDRMFPIQEVAHQQIAEYAGIPLPYYRRMVADDPQLLADNVNRWMADKADEQRMIRTLDGKARAFLSDRFRPLENEDLAEAILPVLLDMQLIILSCEITDRRLYIKAVDTRITRDVPTGKLLGDGSHVFFDTISPGITVSNSEVGHGSLSVERTIFTKMCTNLAAMGVGMRKYHTGTRADISAEVYSLLTDDTKRATDRAVWMQVRDMVKGAFQEAQFDAAAMRLGHAVKDRIEPDKVVEVVERAGRRFSLSEGERKGVLARLIEEGDLTRYGLHAAVTRFSQSDAVSYDRATEFERLGGEIIDMPKGEWVKLTAATAPA